MTEPSSTPLSAADAVDPATVTVYLRLPGSKAAKVQLPPSSSLSDLKSTVASHLGLPAESQVLFLGGRELHEGRSFLLAERSILHVKDRREMGQEVTIRLIRHEPQRDNIFRSKFPSIALQARSGESVRAFLERYLQEQVSKVDLKRSRVIECGRFLRWQKSFEEQKVAQDAEVHLIIRSAVSQNDTDQQHELFVKRVLRHSRNNSAEELTGKAEKGEKGGQEREKGENEEAQEGQEGQESGFFKIGGSALVLKEGEDENNCPQHSCCPDNPHFRHSLQPESLERNPERPMRSSLLSHTKSSERWVRAKVKPSELTPIKLGLTEYKKYEGPLSVRACNCKRRPFESHGRDSVKSEEESPCLSPLPSKLAKSQCRLKKSMTLIS